MIPLNIPDGARVLELGGGANRHPRSTVNVDVRHVQGVDFTVDFNKEEWPEIGNDEFDVVYACFVLEHISWRQVPNFLRQTYRVTKPGGKALFVIPNTEAQMRYILSKPEFDGDEGSMIFGTLDYPENSHRAAFSPRSVTKLFTQAGFTNITITPFGQLGTDMVVEASKPANPAAAPAPPPPAPAPAPAPPPPPPSEPDKPAVEIYGRDYWERYQGSSWVWDYPPNELMFRKVRDHLSPTSVLELGCGRGYVLKRFEDSGIPVQGIDVSRYAYLTRVCNNIVQHDLTTAPWPLAAPFDLALSIMFLEHVPESKLPVVLGELARHSPRGLHAVAVEGQAPNHDATRRTLRSLDWWRERLPVGHVVVDVRELGSGELPQEYLAGDGKNRLNLCCAWTMAYGHVNYDVTDCKNFAQLYHHNFVQHDLRNGIPSATGVVDSIYCHHGLEHFTYEEGLRLLKECRRVIRPDGCMRIVVPDADFLCGHYSDREYWSKHQVGDIHSLAELGEFNTGVATAPTGAMKLWAMLGEGHKSYYDAETLCYLLKEAGWVPHRTSFRTTTVPAIRDVLRMTVEHSYGGEGLFVDATPALG